MNADITVSPPEAFSPDIFKAIEAYNRPDAPDELGALKQFKIPASDKAEEAQAVGRLESEVHALQVLKHPAVIRLLHASIDDRFMVTEYHGLGTLDKNLGRYRGDATAALRAFRELVDGVVEIHSKGAIHRDIKPENIFIAASGDLVLGDFGIVFFQDDQRLTTTYERVGSHYWMAAWAYDNIRLQLSQVKAPLDIYPLGKVLWSMISGRNGFPYWEYKRPDNDLEQMFPHDPGMPLVNSLLSRCVVREESDCLSTAVELRSEIDELIKQVSARRSGFRPDGAETWPCRMCGRGRYVTGPIAGSFGSIAGFSIYVCDHCGHAALFKPH